MKSESEVAQLCLTLSDPMDCSPPGSSVHGIFQARALEWGAIAFSDSMLYSSLTYAYPSSLFSFTFFFNFGALHDMWDLSSLTKDRTLTPGIGNS